MTRFLVVEDEFVIAASLQSILEKNGYTVLQLVATGEEAIEVAEASHPDLVLMDITLAGAMDGIEAAQQITTHFEIPVIYLTAHAHDEILERAKITQPFGYLTKPVKEKDLKVAIEIALYKHKMDHQLAEHDQWLSSVLEAFEEAVIATDTEEKIEFINQVASQWTGIAPNQAHGLPLHEVIDLNHEGIVMGNEESSKLYEEGVLNLWNNFPFFTKPDGGKIPVECHQQTVYSKQGIPQGRLYIFRDVTSIKTLEEELFEAKFKFEYFINHLHSAVLLCDKNGHLLDLNQNTCDLLGYKRDPLLSFTISHIEMEFDHNKFQESLLEMKQGNSLSFQGVYRRKNHASLPVEGIMGVWEKKDRLILLLVFQDRMANNQCPERLSQEFEKTFTALSQTFNRVNHLFQSFDLF